MSPQLWQRIALIIAGALSVGAAPARAQPTAADWAAFAIWLTMLLNRHGQNILRVKGMLYITGVSTPVIIHGVQHTIHPPTHLDAWPEGRPGTRLIFIAKGFTRHLVQESPHQRRARRSRRDPVCRPGWRLGRRYS